MSNNATDIDITDFEFERDELAELVEISRDSPQRLAPRIERIVDALKKQTDPRIEEQLLRVVKNLAKHSPEECLGVVDSVSAYLDHDDMIVKRIAVMTLKEVSKVAPGEVAMYLPAMAAASNSSDDLTKFFATYYIANIGEHAPQKIYQRRDTLLERYNSGDVRTGNAALLALKPVVRNHPDFAVENQSLLRDGLYHEDVSRRRGVASLIRELVSSNAEYLGYFTEHIQKILRDESPKVQKFGVAAVVDSSESGTLSDVDVTGLKRDLEKACQDIGVTGEARAELLHRVRS